MSILTGILLIVMMFLVLGFGVRLIESREIKKSRLEQEMKQARMLSDALQNKTAEIRRYRHDLGGFLASLKEVPSSALSGIIALKKQQCAEQGISFSCRVPDNWETPERGDTPHMTFGDTTMPEDDLASLIQNLLDNALEAEEKIEEGYPRAIELTADDGENPFIRVSNRIMPGEEVSFRTQKENPELHGIGLSVIEQIVRDAGLKMERRVDTQNGWVMIEIKCYPL